MFFQTASKYLGCPASRPVKTFILGVSFPGLTKG